MALNKDSSSNQSKITGFTEASLDYGKTSFGSKVFASKSVNTANNMSHGNEFSFFKVSIPLSKENEDEVEPGAKPGGSNQETKRMGRRGQML